ncbi:MAG: hypothetical protein MJD61_15720, partial [Proteobacteria bacterium]|nr:hypothetical protein [Pseudomonadota bacterium]
MSKESCTAAGRGQVGRARLVVSVAWLGVLPACVLDMEGAHESRVANLEAASSAAPSGNWFFADPHIHSDGCQGPGGPWWPPPNVSPGYLNLDPLFRAMTKRGVDIGSVLIWGPTAFHHIPHPLPPAPATDHEWSWLIGTDRTNGRYPGKILHYDLEVSGYPAGNMGHITVLGLK